MTLTTSYQDVAYSETWTMYDSSTGTFYAQVILQCRYIDYSVSSRTARIQWRSILSSTRSFWSGSTTWAYMNATGCVTDKSAYHYGPGDAYVAQPNYTTLIESDYITVNYDATGNATVGGTARWYSGPWSKDYTTAYGSASLPSIPALAYPVVTANVYGGTGVRNIFYNASATISSGTITGYSWKFVPVAKYTTLDLLKAQKIVMGETQPTYDSYRLYDINEDDNITSRDVDSIQANLLGSSYWATASSASGNVSTYTSVDSKTVDICGNCDYNWELTVSSSIGTSTTVSGVVHTSNRNPDIYDLKITPSRTTCELFYRINYYSGTSRRSVIYTGSGTPTYDTSSIEQTSISLSDLSPFTSYTSRVVETDNNGVPANWDNITFTTTGNSIQINSFYWSTTNQTSIRVDWTTTTDTNDSYDHAVLTVVEKGTETVYNNYRRVSGLSPGTTYTFILRVYSVQGTTATTTKRFTTDKATVTCTSTETLEVGESIWKMKINLSGNYANQIVCNLYRKVNGSSTLVQTKTYSSPPSSLSITWEGLDPGTEYYCSGTITTYGSVSGGTYTSSFSSVHATTLSSNPIKFVKSDGTIEPHEAYVLGRGNLYDNARQGTWQYWRLDDAAVGTAFANCYTSVGTGQGYAMLWSYRAGVAVLPGVSYTLENPSSNPGTCTFYVMEFNGSGVSTSARRTITKGNSTVFTTSSTTEFLLVCLQASTSLTVSTAKNYNLKIFRTDGITPILKNNIVYLNGKIRYIDVIQSGNDHNNYGYVYEVQAYRKNSSTNIALGKTVSLIRGIVSGNSLSNVTDGNTSTYVTLSHGTSPSIIRVDLGQEYTDIDYIVVYRTSGYIFNETAIYGRDADLNLTYKFHDYKITGTYQESSSGKYCYVKYAS